jgi:S-DNA-T family DNA segregation ATPase FtsK/SpoIIIE
MTFPLGSLRGDGAAGLAAPGAGGPAAMPRWRQQLLLLGGGVLGLLVMLALASHQASDPGFSTSGTGAPVANRVGLIGAYGSDLALFLFGYSVWWLPLAGLRAWLALLARALRGDGAVAADPAEPLQRPAWAVWLGLALLMLASCGLEWTRLYRLDDALPGGQAGGVLGAVVGQASMAWLGFAGSGVLWIALALVGLSLALQFSWARTADALGQWIDGLWRAQAEAREVKEDLRIAAAMTREREQVVEVERHEVEDHTPIVIEPPPPEAPPSVRVAKERQKPLFVELADTKLPQVDLLDAAPPRVDSVTPESLEMTSRLIEKKLRDFGVEVRVVAPGSRPTRAARRRSPTTTR